MSRIASTDEAFDVRAGIYAARLCVPSELAPVLRSTLRDLVTDVGPATGVALVEGEPDGFFRVSSDGRLYQSGVPIEAVPDYVIKMLLLAELDANPGELHLHGGLLALGDDGVLVAGTSGAGKSTLVAALVNDGFDYVTDERVAIDAERGVATGFPKPLSLVPGSFHLFPQLDPAATGAGQATGREWQVPASSFGRGRLRWETPVRLVVIVRHESDVALHVERLHPVSAAAELLSDSPDRGRYGDGATAVAAELCARATCVRVTYHRLDDATRAVRDLLDDASPAREVDVLAPEIAPRYGEGGGRIRLSHVLSRHHERPLVVVDGRALAYGRDGLDLVELDELSTGWLMLVDGRSTVAELVDVVQREAGTDPGPLRSGALRVLRSLSAHGLVTRV